MNRSQLFRTLHRTVPCIAPTHSLMHLHRCALIYSCFTNLCKHKYSYQKLNTMWFIRNDLQCFWYMYGSAQHVYLISQVAYICLCICTCVLFQMPQYTIKLLYQSVRVSACSYALVLSRHVSLSSIIIQQEELVDTFDRCNKTGTCLTNWRM